MINLNDIQAPPDSAERESVRPGLVKEEDICPRCQNSGVVVEGYNGSTRGRIGCRECGRGDDMLERLRARERGVNGTHVVVRRARG